MFLIATAFPLSAAFTNHAATNTAWHVIHSLIESRSTQNHYRYMDDALARKQADALFLRNDTLPEKHDWLLLPAAQRPNVVFILMESMTAQVVEELGGEPGVCPNLSRLFDKLMQRENVDPRHTVLHHKLHQDFTEQVRSIWGARSSLSNPAEFFLSFLTSWLCLHVLGVDQSLARQIVLIEGGTSPQQAFESESIRPKDKGAEAMIKALRNTYQVVSRLSLDLISANHFLEERVAARTAELQLANEALTTAGEVEGGVLLAGVWRIGRSLLPVLRESPDGTCRAGAGADAGRARCAAHRWLHGL